MRLRISLLVWVVLLMILSACTSVVNPSATSSIDGYPTMGSQSMEGYIAPQNPSSKVLSGSVSAPVPGKGKASLSGILYQISHSTALSNFLLYLTPAQGDSHDQPPPILAGPLADKGDIPGRTNEKGEFQFNNVPPGRYFLVVAFGYDYDIVVVSESNPVPLLIVLEPDERKALGTVFVP